MSFREINKEAGVISRMQFGKSISVDIRLRDGTVITVETRLEHMDTPIKFAITYPDGTEKLISSEAL